MTKRELVAVLAMGVALFVGGYRYAAAIYGEDIAELREDYASRAQQLEEKYREKERATAQSLVDAWEARDAALARASDLSGDFERERLARLKESALPDAQALSSEAQNWLNEASSFLSGLR